MKLSVPNSGEESPCSDMNGEAPSASKVSGNGDLRPKGLITDLLHARAEAQPESVALVAEKQRLSFGELDGRANQLAHHLLTLGVGPEVTVGLCLDRSPLMAVAALAILKAGGAYIPLDPDYPAERLRFMLEDAHAAVLIAPQEISPRLAGRWRTLDVEKRALQISDYPSTPPNVSTSASNLAYVIYTSGSTGRPKGVQITHQNLLNLVRWHQKAFSISPADRASQLASIGFDAAVWELWPNLSAGCSVYFPDEAVRVAPEPLRDWLVAERITVSFVPTPLAEALIALPWPKETALRLLLTGGDVLHRYPAPGLPFQLVNNYGPTECTVVTTSGIVPPNGNPHGATPPLIGQAIDGHRIYILNEWMQPASPGEIGELHIAGQGVGRGYLNRPELNQQKFLADPFGAAGERMYKTGDLVRSLPDGQISFVGRIDDQIKVRGYRIEPEEIVTLLNRCYGVEASAVAVRGENDDARLVAYIVPATPSKLDHDSLQAYLKKYLPDYMIPAAFVRMESLPIGRNGKIDRSLLPAPTPENTSEDKIPVAPSTPVEARVVAILAELLGIPRVGVHDNFFFLGGHSLLGTQLIARARDSFGIELPLRTVFDSPTASQLSAEIERVLRQTHSSAAD